MVPLINDRLLTDQHPWWRAGACFPMYNLPIASRGPLHAVPRAPLILEACKIYGWFHGGLRHRSDDEILWRRAPLSAAAPTTRPNQSQAPQSSLALLDELEDW